MNRPMIDGGGGGDYSSIKFAGMRSLVSQVTSAGNTLQDDTKSLQSQASACSVSCPAFGQIIEIGAWAEDQVPGLQRRLTLAQGMSGINGMKLTEWAISEPPLSKAEAEKKGQELAQKLKDQKSTNGDMAKAYHEVAGQLDAYGGDPDTMSAFYASLGPQLTQAIPSFLEASGSDTGEEDLKAYSTALGQAMKDPYPPKSFTDVKNMFTTPVDQKDKSTSWARLSLLQEGEFPPAFLAKAVRVNGLEEFSKNGYDNADWRGGGMTPPRLGLSESNVALMFNALRNNPEAARGAFEGLDLKNITKNVYGATDSLGTGEADASAYALAVQAASGTNDETMGSHSKEAADFTLKFMQASGSVKDVPDVVKTSLGKIAASWAPELLTGSENMDAGGRASGMDAPPNFDALPGIKPMFYLNQGDTYKFLHGIGSDDKYTAPFDEAVGSLYDTSLSEAAKLQKAHPDSSVWDNTLRRYGQLAGLEYAAQKDVRGDMDASDAATRSLINNVFGAGLLFVGGPGGALAKAGWKAGMYTFALARGSWVKGDPEATRKALVEDQESRAGFLVSYQLASKLYDAKYPGTEKVPPELLDHGKLKAPKDIAADSKLIAAYQRWTDATDSGKSSSLDQKLDTGTTGFEGGQSDAENQTKNYDW